jgi:hypothetical protein
MAGDLSQVPEHLPSKYKALISKPSTTSKKKRKKRSNFSYVFRVVTAEKYLGVILMIILFLIIFVL